jgi:hypothetical protein
MKFAVLALLGLANAAEVTLPNIEWNPAKVQQGKADFEAWAARDQAAKQADQAATINDLSMAYSRFRVAEAVSFSKNFKPLADWDVQIVDSLTVAGTCNKSIATECVNQYYLGNATKGATETCVYTKAGCTSKWGALTDAQKQALADKYMTDINTLGQAYKKMDQQFISDLQVAFQAHKTRMDAAKADFVKSMHTVATDFGCDSQCLDNCANNNFHSHCFANCKCGTGVIKITPQKVNTLSIVKDTYGDFNQLNEDEVNEVNNLISIY